MMMGLNGTQEGSKTALCSGWMCGISLVSTCCSVVMNNDTDVDSKRKSSPERISSPETEEEQRFRSELCAELVEKC